MDPDALLERLVQVGILAEAESEDRLVLSDSFRATVEEQTNPDDACGVPDHCPQPIRDRPELLALFTTTRERVPDLSWPDMTRTTLVLDQFRRGYPRTDGVPDGFVPVHGDRLPVYGTLHRKAVVYVWSDDCEPCDLMREELGALDEEADDETALLAVCGPENAEFLYDEYGIEGAPTTLFLLDGRVDVRLFGPKPLSDLRTQLSTLEELHSTR